MSNREIAKWIGRSESTVRRVLKKWKETGSIERKKRSRRKRLISEREEKLIVRTVKRQKQLALKRLKKLLKLMHQQKQLKECYTNMVIQVVLLKRNHLLVRRIENQDYDLQKSTRIGKLMIGKKYYGRMNRCLLSGQNYQNEYGDCYQKDLMLIVWLDH